MTNGTDSTKKRCSYNKLWKLLIDRNISRTGLRLLTGMSTSSLAKLGKGDNVTTDVLLRICEELDCDIGDIVEVVPDCRAKLNITINDET